MIAVGCTEKKGRGVFAINRLPEGEIIERAPVIVIADERRHSAGRSALDDYYFEWGSDFAIALGFGSLYNHSHKPNAVFVCRHKRMCIEFVALRDILPGEEVTIHYNDCFDFLSSLWFETAS